MICKTPHVIGSLLIVLLTGCATTSPLLVPQTDQPVAVPRTEPLTMEPVNWQVMTTEQMKVLASKLKPGTVFIVLDEQNFKALSLNLIDIQRYIKEQKAVVLMLSNIIQSRSTGAPPHHE